MREDYDEVVAEYYNEEASTEQRAEENPNVGMISGTFKPRKLLEIGYGDWI